MSFLRNILLPFVVGIFLMSFSIEDIEKKAAIYLPHIIGSVDENNYSKYEYDDKLRLILYENNISLKTREGFFVQNVSYKLDYDKNNRIKTILRTQHSTIDTIPKKTETVKITCSYKDNFIRLRNETNRTETRLELNDSGQLVKSSTIFSRTTNSSMYHYDSDGNVSKVFTNYLNDEQQQIFESTVQSAFDSNNSLTKNLNVPQWFLVFYLNNFGLYNNLTEKRYTDSMDDSNPVFTTITYSYDRNAYPVEMMLKENEDTLPVKMKIHYSSYKKN